MDTIELSRGLYVTENRTYEFCVKGARYEGVFKGQLEGELVFDKVVQYIALPWSTGYDYEPIGLGQRSFPGRRLCELVQLD